MFKPRASRLRLSSGVMQCDNWDHFFQFCDVDRALGEMVLVQTLRYISRKDPFSQGPCLSSGNKSAFPVLSPSFLGRDQPAGLYRRKLTYICGWAPLDTPMPFWTTCQWAMKQKCLPNHWAPISHRQPCYTKVWCLQSKGSRRQL